MCGKDSENKVIMLDIDGVLNNHTSMFLTHVGFNPEDMSIYVMDYGCVRLFEHILLETNAKFVISSTWRFDIDVCMRALKFFGSKPELHKERFIGITPHLRDPGTIRGDEIKAWLDKNPQYTNCVILDDDSDMHEDQVLVKTKGEIGLTVKDAIRCIELLNKKPCD